VIGFIDIKTHKIIAQTMSMLITVIICISIIINYIKMKNS